MLHHEQHSSIPSMNLSQVSNKAQHLVKNQSKDSFSDSFKKSSSSEEEEKVNWSMLGPVLQPGEVRRPSVYVRKKYGNDLLSDSSPSPGARSPGNIVLPHLKKSSNDSDRIRRSLLSNH